MNARAAKRKKSECDVKKKEAVLVGKEAPEELSVVPKAPVFADPNLFHVGTFYSNAMVAKDDVAFIAQLDGQMSAVANYGSSLIPWSEKEDDSSAIQLVRESNEARPVQCFGLEGLRDPFEETWDQGVKQLFGKTLQAFNVPKILLYSDIISDDNVISPQKVNLVFVAQPAVEDKGTFVASKVNRCGRSPSSLTFWEDHLEHRQVGGEEKALLHVAVRIPCCLHPEKSRKEHEDASQRLDEFGHGIGAGFQYATFWGKTAEAFVALADSPIVQVARSAGFQALYALRDGVLRKIDGKYGVRGYKFSSVDNFVLSEVVLLGFWKQYSKDSGDHVLLSLCYNECPLTSTGLEMEDLLDI